MGSRFEIRRPAGRIRGESGYALPSVLMLVTILTMVAGSVITLQYLRRQEVLREMHILKSDFAARNGVARALARISSSPGMLAEGKRVEFDEVYDDSSSSHVEMIPWGMYVAVRAEGYSARFSSELTLLAANRPPREFDPALTLGNLQHQLVMTGSAAIVGDVHLGPSGATTGTLRDYTTPLTLPIDGKVRDARTTTFPRLNHEWVRGMGRRYHALFDGEKDRVLPSDSAGHLRIEEGDTTSIIHVKGSVEFQGEIHRSWPPLVLVVHGALKINPGAHLVGLVLIASSDSIVVTQGARIEDALLISQVAVRVESHAKFNGQMIAPRIAIERTAELRYPSAAVACNLGEKMSPVALEADSGALIEGFAGVIEGGGGLSPESGAILSSGSRVIGVVYSSSRLTADGDVIGSVAAEDFYFYQAPTHYYGWMKQGFIDRTRLPNEFLTPPALARKTRLDVLKWIGG